MNSNQVFGIAFLSGEAKTQTVGRRWHGVTGDNLTLVLKLSSLLVGKGLDSSSSIGLFISPREHSFDERNCR